MREPESTDLYLFMSGVSAAPRDELLEAVRKAAAAQYSVLGEIGRKADGSIAYLARDRTTKTLVALRLTRGGTSGQEYALDVATQLDAFEDESIEELLLEKDPSQRRPSMDAAVAEKSARTSPRKISMRRDRGARPAPARKKRPIMLAAAGAALTVLAVGLIFVFPSNSVKAVAPTGAVTFTASSGNLSPAAPVVATIELTPRYVRIAPGATVPLKILATGRDGNSVAGAKAVWVSYEPGVATVSPEGLVTGVAVGGAVVTATSGGRSASAVVSVARPVVVAPAEPRTVKGSVTAHPATPPRATAAPARPAPARPAPGVLQMLVMPWAYVSIDGQARKQWTRGVDTLSAAVPHRVRFERDGFVTIDTVVKLLPGEQRLLRVQMIARTP